MAKANTSGFRWLPSYYEAIRDLPDPERLAMYDAITDYGFGNEVVELPPILQGFFLLMQPTLEKSIKFEAKQKSNGQKGGRPPKPRETQPKPRGTHDDYGENLDVDIESDIDIDFALDGGVDTLPPSTVDGYYRKMIDSNPSSSSMCSLSDYERALGREVCIKAIDEAVDNGKKTWVYVNAILKEKHKQGVDTLAKWDRQSEGRAKRGNQQVDSGDLDLLTEEDVF